MCREVSLGRSPGLKADHPARVLWVSPFQIRFHVAPGPTPESRQVAGQLDRPVRRGQQFNEKPHRPPAIEGCLSRPKSS